MKKVQFSVIKENIAVNLFLMCFCFDFLPRPTRSPHASQSTNPDLRASDRCTAVARTRRTLPRLPIRIFALRRPRRATSAGATSFCKAPSISSFFPAQKTMHNFVPKSLPGIPMPQKNAPKVTPKSMVSSTFCRAALACRTLPGLPIRIFALCRPRRALSAGAT